MAKAKKAKRFNWKPLFILLTGSTLIVLIAFVWFNKDNAKIKPDKRGLNVVVSNWTGWQEEQPNDEKLFFEVRPNVTINLPGLGNENYEFKILSVDKSIRIQLPSGVSEENKDGGIDLMNKNKQILSIPLDGTKVGACTQTVDAGTCYYFYYKK